MPVSACRRFSSFRYCSWMVTSSAVVGSSAISTSGSPLMAMAPTTRCFMPPLIWCGYWPMRCSGAAISTRRSAATASFMISARGARLRRSDRLAQLVADREHRIERGLRVLQHHRDAPAADLAHLGRRALQDVLAAQQHLALDGARAALGQQAHQRQRRQALAAARFAHQAQHLAAPAARSSRRRPPSPRRGAGRNGCAGRGPRGRYRPSDGS